VRVLMISKACVQGLFQRKLEEIARLGVELTVVVPPGWRDERGWMALERVYTDGYDLRVLPMALNGNFHLHFYPRLRRIFFQSQPQVVHIDEEPYNLATWHAVRLARRAGAKALFFAWQNHQRRYPPPFSWWEQDVFRHSAYAIAGNHDAIGVIRNKGYPGPAYVIPQFGVDPALYQSAQPPEEPFVIGYVGRLVPEKGVGDLLQAASRLAGAWQVRLLGDGPDKERLVSLAKMLGIADRVHFDPWMPSPQVPGYLAQLHALVLPSHTLPNWKEQFGRVLTEAMVSGVPVVGSDSGEIPNVIGDAGLVYPEGDVERLAAHLSDLMSQPDLWARLAQQGKERVLAHYTQAQVAQETVRVYKEMLSS